MEPDFDPEQAKKYLQERELREKDAREQARKALLPIVKESIDKIFSDTDVEVFLVGSITQPYQFSSNSDVDIVLKNFNGDRFDVWSKLEREINRDIEVILFEHCHFQDHVTKYGKRIL